MTKNIQPSAEPGSAFQIERRSIILSVIATSFFGILGIAISLLSRSGAVFLDGLFSLIFAVAGLLTLYVSSLVARPRDEQYPFGYASYEPMLNLFKGILIALALVYAVAEAVRTLLSGGQDASAVGGIIYSALAVVGGVAVIIALVRMNRSAESPIVQVDVRNWVVDTMISAAVGVAFVVALILENSQWSEWAPYADPIIMLLIAAIAVPQPFQIIGENWGQLLGRAPKASMRSRIRELVQNALADKPYKELHLRISEVGRYVYIHVYVVVFRERAGKIALADQDIVRRRIYNTVSSQFRYVAIDIAFTSDSRWALSSVPSDNADEVVTPEDAPAESAVTEGAN